MAEYPIIEIRNPAAVAWEWKSESGIKCAITWTRGTHRLSFAMQPVTGGPWYDNTIDHPERFGFKGTLESAREAARTFINGIVNDV